MVELTITDTGASVLYDGKVGDSYEMKVLSTSGVKTSRGTVGAVNVGTIILNPSNAPGKDITVTASGENMINIVPDGSITYEEGGSLVSGTVSPILAPSASGEPVTDHTGGSAVPYTGNYTFNMGGGFVVTIKGGSVSFDTRNAKIGSGSGIKEVTSDLGSSIKTSGARIYLLSIANAERALNYRTNDGVRPAYELAFVYANKAAVVDGTIPGDITLVFDNVRLKQGWNKIRNARAVGTTDTYSNATIGGGYDWQLYLPD
jgi:hypothetical protein